MLGFLVCSDTSSNQWEAERCLSSICILGGSSTNATGKVLFLFEIHPFYKSMYPFLDEQVDRKNNSDKEVPRIEVDPLQVNRDGIADRKERREQQSKDVGKTDEGVLQGADNQPEVLEPITDKRPAGSSLLPATAMFCMYSFRFHLYPDTFGRTPPPSQDRRGFLRIEMD